MIEKRTGSNLESPGGDGLTKTAEPGTLGSCPRPGCGKPLTQRKGTRSGRPAWLSDCTEGHETFVGWAE